MKFLHSMIRVKNEEKSIRFYCEFLGFKKGERIRLEDCFLQYLVDENTNTQIELTINDEIPQEGYSNGRAFGHFAFECDNLDEINEKMEKMGYKWEIEPFYMPEIKTRIAFLLDPDNNEIELIEKVIVR
ncbi:MAG: VOC family protein [Candidatus Gastranaerophilales bacterium]|nr:VOC family protein [Candidatus Gastranaerophilales bacterium]